MRRDLEDWLAWLENHHPREIELGLGRIRLVADALGLLQPQAKVVTVAGTNGKGSCVAAIACLLEQANLSVGVYTSPHLTHYCERVTVDGSPATEAEVCRAFEKIRAAAQDTSLTYFEYGTLAALDIFRQREVDVMVLEVGLGGRLDAVNILDADLSIITSIALDHQDWLGSDRDQIGREKAGIVRSGRPALCADPSPPDGLAAFIRRQGATLQQIGQTFGYEHKAHAWRWWGESPDGKKLSFHDLPLPELPIASVTAALQGAMVLGLDLNAETASKACQLRLPGRFQRRYWKRRPFILDVAHNPAAARYLAERLAREPAPGRTHGLIGMMRDKDRSACIAALRDEIDQWWVANLPGNPRAMSVDQQEQEIQALSLRVAGSGTVSHCMERLVEETDEGDRIVIMGSFVTVGAALEYMNGEAE